MPPTVVLIRHGEAEHNVDKSKHDTIDPTLTNKGVEQSLELTKHLAEHLPLDDRRIELIIMSPMYRTLLTALYAFLDLFRRDGVPVVADARWQELSAKPCDTGRSIPELVQLFPDFDFSALDPIFPDKTSPEASAYHYNKAAVLARGQAVLKDLYNRWEDIVVVVSHSGFLRTAVAGRWFANADYRVFDFESREGKGEEEPYRLVEWEMTRGKGGMGMSKEELVEFGEGVPE
ncbi:histidine phosphatase superfamily [Chaetomium sp. MPI-SDFR-AT-0129]|nr:histidine phosphatase superfamily [Chaetomium sp. MPI-SDFR-AT-0129]